MTIAFAVHAALMVGIVSTGSAAAQNFPDRPITLVVPYAAGGPTDVLGRILAEEMRAKLGENVVVENRPGAATLLGARHVANAEPDGYTLLLANTTTLSLNPSLYSRLDYSVDDFAPIAMVAKIPIGFAVRADLPVRTMEEFRAHADAQDVELAYGSPGTGSNSQMVNVLMNRTLGIDMLEVPYQGTAPALVDLTAGQVDGLVDAIGTLAPMHQEGQVRILGNFDSQRTPSTPDVPTFQEQGIDLVAFTWNAIVAPDGTSPEIVAALDEILEQVVLDERVEARLQETGFSGFYSGSDDLARFVGEETERWRQLIAENDLAIE